ncbi:type IV pilus modification protein PilV [Thioalkalivibrio sp. ALJ24]|uniref:type IV pilus modification protein PilV n=1 Tax=Thioalkalivibrio sp. ALJ24 TaxID=545276 RepID=UPI00068553AE|nr:type IV pilus modification protein PilV [Thioalkalivibrio sp. ALJ24]
MNRANRTTIGPGRSPQLGVTLIEILVTVLVLSIGLIGLASLQGNALKANQSAYMRAQATILAYDILDVMRVDREAALDQDYDGLYESPPAVETGDAFVRVELNRWMTDVDNTLPDPSGRIDTDSNTGIVTIAISWDDTRGEESPETFRIRTRL